MNTFCRRSNTSKYFWFLFTLYGTTVGTAYSFYSYFFYFPSSSHLYYYYDLFALSSLNIPQFYTSTTDHGLYWVFYIYYRCIVSQIHIILNFFPCPFYFRNGYRVWWCWLYHSYQASIQLKVQEKNENGTEWSGIKSIKFDDLALGKWMKMKKKKWDRKNSFANQKWSKLIRIVRQKKMLNCILVSQFLWTNDLRSIFTYSIFNGYDFADSSIDDSRYQLSFALTFFVE